MSATVYLVGIGPGQAELITPEALAAISVCRLSSASRSASLSSRS